MTSKQIEQLNVKIAKKLGWTDIKKENLPNPLQGEKRTIGIAPGNIRHQYVPNYFGNLAYAMKLVDWAGENGHSFFLEKVDQYRHYYVRFISRYNENVWVYEEAILPSVAICMAFLKIK